jgi:hypothetical protein
MQVEGEAVVVLVPLREQEVLEEVVMVVMEYLQQQTVQFPQEAVEVEVGFLLTLLELPVVPVL